VNINDSDDMMGWDDNESDDVHDYNDNDDEKI
jgi:hypothetical protein